MPGVTLLGRPKAVEVPLGEHLENLLVPVEVGAVVAPRGNHQADVLDRALNGFIVLWADREGTVPKRPGVGGHQGEQVDDLEGAVAPGLGVLDAPGDGGVEAAVIRDARVEHDE